MNPNGVTYTSSDTHYVYHPYQQRVSSQDTQFPGALKGKNLPPNNSPTNESSQPTQTLSQDSTTPTT